MTIFYKVEVRASHYCRFCNEEMASYFCRMTARICALDARVFVGVDSYDVTGVGDLTEHRLVVACLPSGDRLPTAHAAIEKIITPMLLNGMRREILER